MQNDTDAKCSQITDITVFFKNLSEDYAKFTDASNKLHSNLPSLTPDNIQKKCKTLTVQKKHLEKLDNQLFEILQLAGEELTKTEMLNSHRMALFKARFACENLYHALYKIKHTLNSKIDLFDAPKDL